MPEGEGIVHGELEVAQWDRASSLGEEERSNI